MWRRRELLGALGTGAAGLAVLANRPEAQAAAGQAPRHDPRHAEALKNCEEACGHCEATCNTTFHHCITQAAAGKTPHATMAQMVADCAAFCNLSAVMIARHSPLMVESCRACAEACRRCAQECSSSDADDLMKTCVTACRRCEESCRNMVRVMGGEH
jgi:hypothetical protein